MEACHAKEIIEQAFARFGVTRFRYCSQHSAGRHEGREIAALHVTPKVACTP
jgi:hypothetical protein